MTSYRFIIEETIVMLHWHHRSRTKNKDLSLSKLNVLSLTNTMDNLKIHKTVETDIRYSCSVIAINRCLKFLPL